MAVRLGMESEWEGLFSRALLCFAVLCCAVLCCALLCFALREAATMCQWTRTARLTFFFFFSLLRDLTFITTGLVARMQLSVA